MEPTDLTLEILKDIRSELRSTNTRLDQANARLDQTNTRLDQTNAILDQANARLDTMNGRLAETENKLDALGRRVVESEIRTATAITELAGSVQDLTRMLRAQHDLRPRVEQCEPDIAEIRRRLS